MYKTLLVVLPGIVIALNVTQESTESIFNQPLSGTSAQCSNP